MCAKPSKKTMKGDTIGTTNDKKTPTTKPQPPDRATWPGWVTLESDPAYFNVMLKEMGVKGVKLQETVSLDEFMLATLPQPVHAFIFLFRYKNSDVSDTAKFCPDHIWFANQVGGSNCASLALLNIINNIPGLTIGDELRRFREATQPMSPYQRGGAVDTFTFVKRIHNSFASANDMLEADMELQKKAAAAKRVAATKKAKATKAETKLTAAEAKAAKMKTNAAAMKKFIESPKVLSESSGQLSTPPASSPPSQYPPPITTPTAAPSKRANRGKRARDTEDDGACETKASKKPAKGHKAPPPAPESASPATSTPNTPSASAKPAAANLGPRRSGRVRKPRGSGSPAKSKTSDDEGDDGEYHYVAYMPIKDRAWKLDGIDGFPQDLGPCTPGTWMEIVAPILQARMTDYASANIEFSCQAVVHDPLIAAKEQLVANVKGLRAVEKALGEVLDDWRNCQDVEEADGALSGACPQHEISLNDLGDGSETAAEISDEQLKEHDGDMIGLLELRRGLLRRQSGLRWDVRELVIEGEMERKHAENARTDFTEYIAKNAAWWELYE